MGRKDKRILFQNADIDLTEERHNIYDVYDECYKTQ